jgi:NAD(P)-dependent dehydrogenase (short-subunit alcohol dehydrogenase family)
MGALDGRTILITGASSGLGEHWVRLCVAQGARVVAAARRRDRLEALADACGAAVHPLAMDVTDAGSVAAGFAEGAAALGPIDAVVANAGIAIDGPALDLTADVLDATFATNVRGAILTVQEGARRMIAEGTGAREAGRIVIVSSVTADRMVSPALAAYSASKAAVVQAGRVMAREWARAGIGVNMLCPGYVATDINAAWFASEAGRRHIATWPRRRLMAAGDMDGIVTFLLSDAARATTGSVFTIDDGQSL